MSDADKTSGYEIPKRLGYPRTVFYDDGIVFNYKDGREICVNVRDIDRIEYVKPSLRGYFWSWLSGGSGYPGRMEIYMSDRADKTLLNRADNRKMYLIKITEKHIYKLPEFFKRKMGLYD